jgi:hypothetical protein
MAEHVRDFLQGTAALKNPTCQGVAKHVYASMRLPTTFICFTNRAPNHTGQDGLLDWSDVADEYVTVKAMRSFVT